MFAYTKCLLRTWCINCANSTRGMQEIGLIYAMEPGLRKLYPDANDFSKALNRYAEHTNTHPFFVPLFVGILLSMEEMVARGQLSEEMVLTYKKTTATTLSAVGDTFFCGSLLPFWALTTILLITEGFTAAALIFGAASCAGLTLFRFFSFFLGLKKNILALSLMRRFDLINNAARIKVLNALLLAVLLWRLLPADAKASWEMYGVGAVLLTCAAYAIHKWQVPRLLLFSGALGALLILDCFFNTGMVM